MSLTNRLSRKHEAPQKQPQYNDTDVSVAAEDTEAEDTEMSEQILVRNSRRNHPMRRATDLSQRGNIFVAGSGPAPEDEIRADHLLASALPVEQTAIDAEGRMDNHRKPIISVNGKDIDEHELGKNVA